MNLQDSFLNQVRKDNAEIKMILLDGTTLVGTVRGFDSFTVIVASGGSQHLVYKHAIAHIVSRRFPTRRESRPPAEDQAPVEKDTGAPVKPEGFNTLNLSSVVVSE